LIRTEEDGFTVLTTREFKLSPCRFQGSTISDELKLQWPQKSLLWFERSFGDYARRAFGGCRLLADDTGAWEQALL